MNTKNPAAVALGKLGGSANTVAQNQARRKNGKKGGRPRNNMRAELYIGHGNLELEFESSEDRNRFMQLNQHPGFESHADRRVRIKPEMFDLGYVWPIQFLTRTSPRNNPNPKPRKRK